MDCPTTWRAPCASSRAACEDCAALLALRDGQEVGFDTIRLVLDAGGIRAVDTTGRDLGSHEAFWFAWSQFYPDTELWSG